MLTACFMGILMLSAAVWSYKELEAVSIPIKEWNLTVAALPDASGTIAAPKQGDPVDLFSPGASAEEPGPKAVTATVESVQPASGQNTTVLTIRNVTEVQAAAAPERDQTLVSGGFRGQVTVAQSIRYFDILYLQASVVGVILITGAILIYWLVGVRRPSVEFLIATDGEMKKVNWSTRREVMGSTWVVIGACFLIAAFLFVIDVSFSAFFKFVGLLNHS